MKFKPLLEIPTIIGTFILSFSMRFIALNQTAFANGWDGYYYLIQIKAIVEEGAMHSSDISLIYPFNLLIYFITKNYILSYKVTASILAGLYSISVFFLSKTLIKYTLKKEELNKVMFSIPFFITCFSIFSPSLTFLTSQFPKNLMGFLFFNMFLISLIPFVSKFINIKKFNFQILVNLFFVIITSGLCFVTHRMAAALCLMILSLIFLSLIFYYKKYKIIIFGLIGGVIIVVASTLFPGIIHISDLKRFEGLFSFIPQISSISFITLLGKNKFTHLWIAELLFLYAFLVFFIIRSVKSFIVEKKLTMHPYYLFTSGTCLIMAFPFYNFNLMGMAYRFFFCFLLLSPFLMIPLIKKFSSKQIVSLSIILIILSFFAKDSYSPDRFDPPYKFYKKLSFDVINKLEDESYDLLVAHKALAEILTFSSGTDALPWQPEKRYSYNRVWRITSGVSYSDFKFYFEENTDKYIKKLYMGYYLIREDRWQSYISLVKRDNDSSILKKIFSWKNPFQVRPDFLTKRKNL